MCKEIHPARKADELCRQCRDKIKRLEAVEKEIAEISREMVPVCFAAAPHWNASYYMHGYEGQSGINFRDEIQRALFDLAMSVTVPALERNHADAAWILGKADSGSSYNDDSYRYGLKSACDSIMRLQKLIQPMIDELYARGKADGNRLLVGLASGDVSLSQFNQATIGAQKEK